VHDILAPEEVELSGALARQAGGGDEEDVRLALLAELLGVGVRRVNSRHHQAVRLGALGPAAEEMERTWLVRLLAIVFTESVSARQVPATPRTSAWPPSLPSVPTSRATRVTSSANEDS